MIKRAVSLLASLLMLAMCVPIAPSGTSETIEAKNPVNISAGSAVVLDVQSGAVLYSKNPDKKQYPASITKVMTALLAIENSSLDESVKFSANSIRMIQGQGASNINVVPGEKLSMEDCLYAILLMSANEVCNGVAEHIAGSVKEYVKLMNKRAKELGCTGTHFANANGLWMKKHYTTAHDMALISRAAYKNKTFARITGTKRYNIKKTNKNKYGHQLHNHHGMLLATTFPQYEYKYCVGGKTGYTSKCRYTLVTYAKKKGTTLLSVIMRAPNSPWTEPNEYTDTIKLLNYGFNNFKRYKITKKEISKVNEERLFSNFSPFYSTAASALHIDDDAGILLPKGVKFSQADKHIDYYDTATIDENGDRIIGKLYYTYDGKEVGGSNIYYTDAQTPTLKDSINMTQWFNDAVEKAKKEPFPWTIVMIILGIVLLLAIAFVLIYPQLSSMKQSYSRSHRYQKNKKSGNQVKKTTIVRKRKNKR